MPGCEASPRINAYSGPHVCHIVGQCGVGDQQMLTMSGYSMKMLKVSKICMCTTNLMVLSASF